LPIWVTIDFQRFVESGRFRKNPWPISLQSESKIVNAAPWVREDVDVRIAQRREISLGLIVDSSQGRVE
jgi:hypothetical protein